MTKQEKDQKIEEIFNIVPIARPIAVHAASARPHQ